METWTVLPWLRCGEAAGRFKAMCAVRGILSVYKRCYSYQIVQGIKMSSMYRRKLKRLVDRTRVCSIWSVHTEGAFSKCLDEVENRLDTVRNSFRPPASRSLLQISNNLNWNFLLPEGKLLKSSLSSCLQKRNSNTNSGRQPCKQTWQKSWTTRRNKQES